MKIEIADTVDLLALKLNSGSRTINLDEGTLESLGDLFSKPNTLEISDDTLEKLKLFIGDRSNTDEVKEVTLSESTLAALAQGHASPHQEPHIWVKPNKSSKMPMDIIGLTTEQIEKSLNMRKALLLEGVPGTGKSKAMRQYITEHAIDRDHYKIMSFNPNTSYAEFVTGLLNVDGSWRYVDGCLLSICKLANAHSDEKYYLGIDEFSRGNTEVILGEAITAIECRDEEVTLANGESLVIPSNLYIIAAMNVSDDSTKVIDKAVYERFDHIRLEPQWNTKYLYRLIPVDSFDTTKLKAALANIATYMSDINDSIKSDERLGEDNLIGTRVLTIPDMDIERLQEAIRNLISVVKKRMERGGTATRGEITKQLAKIRAEGVSLGQSDTNPLESGGE